MPIQIIWCLVLCRYYVSIVYLLVLQEGTICVALASIVMPVMLYISASVFYTKAFTCHHNISISHRPMLSGSQLINKIINKCLINYLYLGI